jgi:STE24 endopeptidase
LNTASDEHEADPPVTDPTETGEAAVADEMTAAERAEARRYGQVSLACTLADIAIDVVFLAIAAFVLARPIDRWLAGFEIFSGARSFLRLLALFGVIYVLHVAVSLPLSFYSGYVVEHQFGLSTQSVRRWLRNWLLGNGLAVAFGLGLYVGLFALMWYTGGHWWLYAAAAFFVVSVI